MLSSPEGYAVVLDSGYCSCPFLCETEYASLHCAGFGLPASIVEQSSQVLLCPIVLETKYAQADFVETVSGGIAGEFHIFLWKMDLACRDQLSSLWRQSADFTLLAGIFDATDIHGDRVCLTRYVPACGGVCCGIANGSVKRCRMSFGLSGDPPPSDEPTRETIPVLSCRVQSTVSASCASSIRLHIVPSSSTCLKRTTSLPFRVSPISAHRTT